MRTKKHATTPFPPHIVLPNYRLVHTGMEGTGNRQGAARNGQGGGGTFHVRVGPVLTQHMRGWGGCYFSTLALGLC